MQIICSIATHSLNLKWFQKFYDAFVAKFPSKTISSTEVHVVVKVELVEKFKPKTAKGTLVNFNKDESIVLGMPRRGRFDDFIFSNSKSIVVTV